MGVTRRQLAILAFSSIKLLVTASFVGLGVLVGLVGLGGGGAVSIEQRLVFRWFLLGGLCMFYPCSRLPLRGAVGWLLIVLAAVVLTFGIMLEYRRTGDVLGLIILTAMSVTALAAATAERVLVLIPDSSD